MKEFRRYTMASALALVIDMGLLYALTEWFDMYYLMSATIGFTAGAVVAYVLSITWCFSHRCIENQKLEFILFVGIGIASLGLNNLLIWSFTELLGLYYMMSKILTTGAVFLFNYFVRRKLLFTPKATSPQTSSCEQ